MESRRVCAGPPPAPTTAGKISPRAHGSAAQRTLPALSCLLKGMKMEAAWQAQREVGIRNTASFMKPDVCVHVSLIIVERLIFLGRKRLSSSLLRSVFFRGPFLRPCLALQRLLC